MLVAAFMPSRLAAVSSFCPLPGGDPAISSHPVQHVQPWTGLVGLDFIRILGTPIPNSNPALFAKYVARFCGRLFQNDAPVGATLSRDSAVACPVAKSCMVHE